MNLKCNAIFANQTNETSFMSKIEDGNSIKMLSTETTGVGINRNIGIMLSTADICILSDDDMIYNDDYLNIIEEAFSLISKADIIIFNIDTIGSSNRKRRTNKKIKKINNLNFMNYGAARIAFKRNAIINNNIFFSMLFGGGTKYSSGEDSLFLADALKKKLKIYAYPKEIAKVNQLESSWFKGYDKKFYYDKGALIGQLHPFTKYFFLLIYFPLRFKSNLKYKNKVKYLVAGMKQYKNNLSYKEWENQR